MKKDGQQRSVAPSSADDDGGPARLRELEAENDGLRGQVKTLVRTESKLYKVQEQLDQQIKIFRKLYDLGQRISVKFDLEEILPEFPTFAIYELGYQRCLVLLDDRHVGAQTVRASDGYYGDEWPARLAALSLPASDALPALAHARKKLVHRVDAPLAELGAIGEALGMHHLLAFPLYGGKEELLGVLVAGNTQEEEQYYVAVAAESESAYGLANLAAQASSAISTCLLYRELAEERNLLEEKVVQRTGELRAAFHALEEKDVLITEDLHQAREFQQGILPAALSIPGLDMETIYRPVDLVGGDLYDVVKLGDHRVRVFLADAVGHGVRAALTTMFIKSEYEFLKRTASGPGELLRLLNTRIAHTYGHLGMRFTAVCLDVDVTRGLLRHASAAHPDICLVRRSVLTELDGGGAFIGVHADADFPERRTVLEKGDGVYLFTDGISEQWSSTGEAFGDPRLYAAIAEAHASGTAAGEAVLARLEEFVGNTPKLIGGTMLDDITFIGLRWADKESA